jgi:uncharacterized protein (DUF39 family)
MDELLQIIERLKEENEELKSKLIDLTFEMNYSKEVELIEFLRSIYSSIQEEMNFKTRSKLSKSQMLYSLKKNIEEFAKNNKISL